mmetsp:Transcript_22616/g.32420  ORF Transcript_22616/g.32420 Transcript_22616/m.32420 type:complete len:110 (+) Transcript_22616:119-448(+)
MSSFLSISGCLLIIHSALSCLYFRGLVQDLSLSLSTMDMDADTVIPPMDVKIEVMVGFVLCLVGQLIGVGSLRPISGVGAKKLVAPSYVDRDFDSYDNRNRVLRTQIRQ